MLDYELDILSFFIKNPALEKQELAAGCGTRIHVTTCKEVIKFRDSDRDSSMILIQRY